MKIYFQTPAILLLGLVFMFCSCTSPEPCPELPEEIVTAPPPFTDCTTACVKKKGSYEIDSGCYDCMVNNYKANKYQLLPAPNGESMKGFNVDIAEYDQVMAEINKDGNAEVFTMLGIKKTIDSATRVETLSSELIFVVKKVNSDGGALVETKNYYDFTKPCPDFCP